MVIGCLRPGETDYRSDPIELVATLAPWSRLHPTIRSKARTARAASVQRPRQLVRNDLLRPHRPARRARVRRPALLTLANIRAWRGHFGPKTRDHLGVEVPGIYWRFVDAMWIVVFTTVYILRSGFLERFSVWVRHSFASLCASDTTARRMGRFCICIGFESKDLLHGLAFWVKNRPVTAGHRPKRAWLGNWLRTRR
jgi:hypothetical protein